MWRLAATDGKLQYLRVTSRESCNTLQPCEPLTGLASKLNVELWAGASNCMRTTLTFGGGVSPSPDHTPCPHHATDSFRFQRASPFNYSYIVCSTSCIVHVRPNTPPPRVPPHHATIFLSTIHASCVEEIHFYETHDALHHRASVPGLVQHGI